MVCTIYNGNLEEMQARLARIALMMFNDVILRVAFEHHLDVIDLRLRAFRLCKPDPTIRAGRLQDCGGHRTNGGGLRLRHKIQSSFGTLTTAGWRRRQAPSSSPKYLSQCLIMRSPAAASRISGSPSGTSRSSRLNS